MGVLRAAIILCALAVMLIPAVHAKQVVQKSQNLAECHTELLRDGIVESKQSYSIEIEIETHATKPDELARPALSITVEDLRKSIDIESRKNNLETGYAAVPEEWGTWRIRDFSGNDSRSFGIAASSLCNSPCAFHRAQGVDLAINFFVIARPSGAQLDIGDRAKELAKHYPGSSYAHWVWIAYDGYQEQFVFSPGQDKLVREVGSCKWSSRKD